MIFTVSENCELRLIGESHLQSLSINNTKIYFSGGPSNPTTFEDNSSNLKVEVLAGNDTTVLILLCSLRYIIDDRSDMLIEDVFWGWVEKKSDPKSGLFGLQWGCCKHEQIVKNGEQMSIVDICYKLLQCKEDYMCSFTLDQVISTNFIKEEYNFTKINFVNSG